MRLLPAILASHLLLLCNSDDSIICYCGKIVLHTDANVRVFKKETTSCTPGDKAYNKAHLNGKCYTTIVAERLYHPGAEVVDRTITIYFNRFDVYNRIFDNKRDKSAIINHISEKRDEWSFTFKCDGDFCMPNFERIANDAYLVPSYHAFANNFSMLTGYERKRYTILKTMREFASFPPKFRLVSKTVVKKYRTASICYCGKIVVIYDVQNILHKKEVVRCYPGKDAYYPDALNRRCYITLHFVEDPEDHPGRLRTVTMYFNKFDIFNRLIDKHPEKTVAFNNRSTSVWTSEWSYTFACEKDYCTPNIEEFREGNVLIPRHHNFTLVLLSSLDYEVTRILANVFMPYFAEGFPRALNPTTTKTSSTTTTTTKATSTTTSTNKAANVKPTNGTKSRKGKRNNLSKMLIWNLSKANDTSWKKLNKGNRWY